MGTESVRIEGGFVGIDPRAILHAWKTCQNGPAGSGGFRTWLALREMVARRCGSGTDRRMGYGHTELARLLGVAERSARASLRRLVAAGLVEWSEAEIAFPECPVADRPLEAIGAGCGVVAIPRRLIRFLAKRTRPALVAVALGAVLRCISRRRSGFGSRGRFKSSWVAETFGVAERHARSARAELVRIGWLEPDPDDAAGQLSWNRWGRAFMVRLDWRATRIDRPTRPAVSDHSSSYPYLQPGSSPERKLDPEPAVRRPAGALLGQECEQAVAVASPKKLIGGDANLLASAPAPAPALAPAPAPAPDLRKLRPVDLEDTGRVLALHRQAVAAGKSTASEAHRLRFVAAAEHARAVGRQNPCGLFARIVGQGWWHLLTQNDEDRAVRRLREHDRPAPAASSKFPPKPGTQAPFSFGSPNGTERPMKELGSLARLLMRLRVSEGMGNVGPGIVARSSPV